ncbi:MAG: hypothetical protein K9J12_01620 [Melioribacteraceae bacterium]|nr:hypothetical protein [Melioribacteraceae bacterium]MCF8264822.1 hypothetical protein [Melioribacteraceae bacterium]MCF8432590.1 hypothetical protein [Melioribacteraceae bacterium]
MKIIRKSFLLLLLTILVSCSVENENSKRVVIGITSDIESFNPLYAFSITEGNLGELLFPVLVSHTWDFEKGEIESDLSLAKNIEWIDGNSVKIKIHEDRKWSDGESITVEDLIYSFILYSHPEVESRLFDGFENYNLSDDGVIDSLKTFDKINDFEIILNFSTGAKPSVFDFDFPLLPKHYFKSIDFIDIPKNKFNSNPVTGGEFFVSQWEKGEFIELLVDKNSSRFVDGNIEKLVFRIVPEYNSRLMLLKTGGIDIMEDLRPDDLSFIDDSVIELNSIKGREYDYIGFNHDDEAGNPHPLFSDAEVRIAITQLNDRELIVDEYLNGFGEPAISPISEIFASVYDSNLKPYPFGIEAAVTRLNKAGWKDSNQNGILDKNGSELSFDLLIPTGNPRREYVATLFKNNAQKAGIKVNLVPQDLGALIEMLQTGKADAWIAGWSIALPVELTMFWSSNPDRGFLNFQNYANPEMDVLLDRIEANDVNRNELYKKFQKTIHNDQPVSFLYWVDNIVGVNSRVKNVSVTPLGVIHHCWNWRIEN